MVAMTTSLNSLILSTTTIFITLLYLLSPASSFLQKHSSDATRGLLFEEKTRLGSTPPSCHNRCNQCHPCTAVQVPTLPSHDRVQQGRLSRAVPLDYYDPSPSAGNNKYSNYKPLGWKCRCGGHFYNP
ncbi:hypothetical protein RJ639_037378 [Escallonia herrerae]|uniref:Epidermal patterning factor-like protein n=1 Tax=Escallonia herrerae TaxID=1293975 RepID=A0AA88WVB2_9ASTE|nr:hypothetical protein RJ639_037378 [Escallonia herrerae]